MTPPAYDFETDEIIFDGTRILIDRRESSGEHVDFCRLLFRDEETMREGLQYADFLDLLDISDRDKQARMKGYHIARWVEKVVYRETGKSDFVVFTTYKAKINPLYIAK